MRKPVSSDFSSTYFSQRRMEKYKRLNLSKREIEEKEKNRCIRLVVLGNFLEYYDLSLFAYLMFILNPIFLPTDDPNVETIGKVFMFCSAYLMRPVGALFWGWIGDRYGRTVVLNGTMMLMGTASMAITTIPSYASWGLWSSLLVLMCRFVQGFAAGGEVQAATIYMAEYNKIPEAYYKDGIIGASCSLGQLLAGMIATACLYFFPKNGWMIPFWFGGILAVMGTWARQALKETPTFLQAMHETMAKKAQKTSEITKDMESDGATVLNNMWTVCFALCPLYAMSVVFAIFSFAYCPELLSKMGLEPSFVTAQSTFIAGAFVLSDLFWAYRAYKTNNPFSLFKRKAIVLAFLLLLVALFPLPQNFIFIGLVQLMGCLESGPVPLTPLFIRSFPVLTRCRTLMMIWAVTKAVMYFVTAYIAFWIGQKYGSDSVVWLIFAFSLWYIYGAFRSEALLKDIAKQG